MNLNTFEVFQAQAHASGIIFYHSGEFNSAIITAAAESLKHRMEEAGASGPAKRKLFSTFVEMAQNIVHYAALPPDAEPGCAVGKPGTIGIGKNGDDYWVVCVNRVETAHIARLSEKLDAVRSMSLEDIRKSYRAQLHNTEHETTDTVSKGAGLGWLTIARDSKQPLAYSFSSDLESQGKTAFFFVKAVV
ncbi:MAG: SiaB family protein kinase [Rhodoferax sp.]|nr:SiaB family protein kinase [Rhodoferax sp.]MDP3654251.1 SiaB family protein kinase [Rhodoferax sp.]